MSHCSCASKASTLLKCRARPCMFFLSLYLYLATLSHLNKATDVGCFTVCGCGSNRRGLDCRCAAYN